MKSIWRGPYIPLVAMVLLPAFYGLSKYSIISIGTSEVLAMLTFLIFMVWEIWWMRTEPKESAAE